MADQVLRIDAGQLFFTNREGDDRDLRRLDAGIGELLIERHVGVAVDRRNDRGLFAGGGELLDRRDLGLPIGIAEGSVVDLDVFGRDTLRFQVGLEDLVGRALVIVVGAFV